MPPFSEAGMMRSSSENREVRGVIESKQELAETPEQSELRELESRQKELITAWNESKKRITRKQEELKATLSKHRQEGMDNRLLTLIAEAGADELTGLQEDVTGLRKELEVLEKRRAELKFGKGRSERPN